MSVGGDKVGRAFDMSHVMSHESCHFHLYDILLLARNSYCDRQCDVTKIYD